MLLYLGAFLMKDLVTPNILVYLGAFLMKDLVTLLPMLDELCVLQLSGAQVTLTN